MILYGVISYIILKNKMRGAVHAFANIYESEHIKSPFVLGVFRPTIYLPPGLSIKEQDAVIFHERTHIQRRDHIVKLIAFFILCIHWFNPLAWVAFILMGADMEMSCDERALNEKRVVNKKDYSMLLLSLATERSIIGASPLAFGEGEVKSRIKNILNFRKPARAVVIIAVVCVAVLSMGFALNRADVSQDHSEFSVRASDVSEADSLSDYRVPTPYAKYTGELFRYSITLKYFSNLTGNNYLPLLRTDIFLTDVFSKEVSAEEYLRSFVYENRDYCIKAELINYLYIENTDPGIPSGYEVNENGQTYGSALIRDELGYEPDLVSAMGVDGTLGYVYSVDLADDFMPSNPKEALTWQLENAGKSKTIPLYDSDGKSIIGEFFIGGHEFTDEEIRNMIDAINSYD